MESNNVTPEIKSNKHEFKTPVILIVIAVVIFATMAIFGVLVRRNQDFPTKGDFGFTQFSGENDLRQYINSSTQSYYGGITAAGFGATRDLAVSELAAPTAQNANYAEDSGKRVSQTNVQVEGVDEPDVIKTDGKNIFYSPNNVYYYGRGIVEPLMFEDKAVAPGIAPAPDYQLPTTKVINALPPTATAINAEIDKTGDLLADGNILVVFEYNQITGFDVSDSANPKQVWQYSYDENFSLKSARLYQGEIYLVTSRWADASINCPIPLLKGTNSLTIACTDIYRPTVQTNVDTIYSVVRINSQTGTLNKTVTFVGSQNSGVVYMSTDNIYTTYTTFPNPLNFMARFFSENQNLISADAYGKINNMQGYDISDESKLNELQIIIQKYLSQFNNDDRAKKQNDIQNAMDTYLKEHGRELQKTAIVKINRADFEVKSIGEIPGSPLNQFSLDEYNGNLRVATTISANTVFGSGDTANDVYVLDSNMNTVGQIQGLALGERIYSARFIGDKGYLVTFKQIDPFFVLDLANPSSPKVAGELKIPGYSSYLHELSNNIILGIGAENNQTKLSVFNVSDPNNPIETDKYQLNEYYSEVQNNHHAFLHDPDKGIFFMPAGNSGYIFSYTNGLKLERVVSDIGANRAVFIGNNLYILGSQKMVVVSEDNFQDVGELNF